MQLDIRWLIGALFTSIGALLVAYGLWGTDPGGQPLGVDVRWGALLVLFGAAMLILALRGRPDA